MKLYVSKGVANARKVQAVASRLGIEPELVWLDYFCGDVFSETFGRINPTLRLPALEDDGFLLWESTAINKYFCDLCPGNSLYPLEPKLRADIERWLSWDLAHYNSHYSLICLEAVVKPNMLGLPSDAQAIDWAIPHLRANAAVLEKHLDGRQYLVGQSITLADYAIGSGEFFQHRIPFDWSAYPNVNAFYDRMRADRYLAATAVAPEEMGRRPKDAPAFQSVEDSKAAERHFEINRSQ